MVASVTFTPGNYLAFEAVKDFGLNFEDRKIKSFKIRVSDVVYYDGDIAKYTSPKGEEVQGKCPSLKSAINAMGWLTLKSGDAKKMEESAEEPTPAPKTSEDFDGNRGGSFDTYANRNRDNVHVAKYQLVKESDLIVGEIPSIKRPSDVREKKATDLSAVGDQVEVRDNVLINSSTVTPKQPKFSSTVTRMDDMGTVGSPIKNIKKAAAPNRQPSNTFRVDKSGAIPSEEVTKEDLKKTIKRSEESQEARVVGKINKGKNMEVQSVDGITLRTVASPKEVTMETKLSSGGESVISVQDAGKVVGSIKSVKERDIDAATAAAQRAAARKAASVVTQTAIEKEKEASAPAVEPGNYLSMLPADWTKLHWVKKEKFIKSQDDASFVKYISSVEKLPAIQKACTERLSNLG